MPYSIVIEPQEYDQYASVINPDKILVLPFSNLGMGSIPARNWVWEHSISLGAKWHWIMDDNIQSFWRLNRNLRIRVASGTIFKCAEDFVDRYENVGQAGLQYYMFCPDRDSQPAYIANTRCYSCILNNNAIAHRWRGKYNEDTDLSIRILKDGWCTILFNAFLAQKETTGTVKGGNMDELYGGNNQTKNKGKEWIEKRRLMAQSLVDQHPDICKITWRWNRPQHLVNYAQFKKNKLVRKPGIVIPDKIDNYGMRLIEIKKPSKQVAHKQAKALPMVTPKKEEKDFTQDYWANRGFCGTQKLTDSIPL